MDPQDNRSQIQQSMEGILCNTGYHPYPGSPLLRPHLPLLPFHALCLLLYQVLKSKTAPDKLDLGLLPKERLGEEVERVRLVECIFCKEQGAAAACDRSPSCNKYFHNHCSVGRPGLTKHNTLTPSCLEHTEAKGLPASSLMNSGPAKGLPTSSLMNSGPAHQCGVRGWMIGRQANSSMTATWGLLMQHKDCIQAWASLGAQTCPPRGDRETFK